MWGATPLDQMMCRIKFKSARYEGIFTPPGLYDSIIYPGTGGGTDWGSISVDDDNKVVIANTNDFPMHSQLLPRENVVNPDAAMFPSKGTPYVTDMAPFTGPLAIPCNQPPWGKLAAFDLKTNKIVWRYPIGTARASGPLGIPSKLPMLIGTLNFGGTLTTRGGLIFIGATFDNYFRAYDSKTGRMLWEYKLPVGGHATPMTYMSGGKQYVVITAAGHQHYNPKVGDLTIAFKLPD
jgi:quinoprotein glucose dehydrogenase